MQLNKEIAEVVGALLGDGCISRYWSRSESIWRYEIAVTGSHSDFNYYKNFIQPMFQKHFNLRGRLFIRKDNSTRYHIRSKRVFDFFESLGIPVGKKGALLAIPSQIVSNKALAIACIRGIWNTDGSIYRRYTKIYPSQKRFYGNYLVMELKMIAGPLVLQVKEILDSIGVETARISKRSNYFVLKIGKQKAIASYFKKVNFSNKHHFDRLNRFFTETDCLKRFASPPCLSGPVAQSGRAADKG